MTDLRALPSRLPAAHRGRVRRALAEVDKLSRWAEFVEAYERETETTPRGGWTALRLRLGEEYGLDDRETRRALWGG